MSIKARRLLVILLILAQGITLWQGVFASGRFNAVNSENIACHQAPISDESTQTNDMQNCCDKCCMGFCHCNHCACSSIFLISSFFNISNFPFQIFNFSTFPTYLDGILTRLFKPPRTFRS